MPEQQKRLLADRYELIAPLGRGTMGTVWRAHDRLLGRDVAVKEIRQDSGLSKEQRAELRERMIREGRNAAKIAHPSVATVHDAILVEGSPWIVMELVEARSLEQVIDEEGPLPPRLVAEIGLDLLGALGAAHEQGVLHRDVKPGNVLLTDTGRVVLTDFGIAKSEGDSNITKTGMVIGSPGYTAPERARGDHTGPESDLWSLGATLYFAVEGRPAYERASVSETLAALMTERADPATQAGPLRPVLEGLLEKDYTKRLTYDGALSMLRKIAKTSAALSPAAKAPQPAKPVKPVKPTTPAEAAGPAQGAAQDRATAQVADTDQTMMVIRPKGGLRIPGVDSPPVPAGGTSEPAAGGKPGSGAGGASGPSSRRTAAAPPASAAASARPPGDVEVDEDGDATMVGRLAPIPAAMPEPPPSAPRPSAPHPSSRRPSGPPSRPGPPPRPGQGSGNGTGPVPHRVSPARPPQAAVAAPPRPAPGTISPQAAPYAGGGEATEVEPGTPETGLGTDLFAFQGTAPPRGNSPVGMIILVVIALLGLATIVMLVASALSDGGPATRATGAKAAAGTQPGGTTATGADASTTIGSGGTTLRGDTSPGTSGDVAPAPAPGLRRHTDKTGFVIDVPAKLSAVAKGAGVGFSAAGDPRTMRVSRSDKGSADVLNSAKAAETRALAAGTYPGYKRIRIGATRPAPYTGTDVADWEFRYTSTTGPVRVFSRWVSVPGGPLYAIYWSAPEARWQAQRAQLGTVLSSFRPARKSTSGGS
ncbi:serine/threonine-protein kinase [Sphaerisporangium perillae]|uniref:serine/threonine-protein kinase n=1 Tax=Sphaerisporangium perillae TaxID=2935860 RepID=UPI00200F13F0|nr:serine/threonine-protein kinase [Sphaerisporangium perillae]